MTFDIGVDIRRALGDDDVDERLVEYAVGSLEDCLNEENEDADVLTEDFQDAWSNVRALLLDLGAAAAEVEHVGSQIQKQFESKITANQPRTTSRMLEKAVHIGSQKTTLVNPLTRAIDIETVSGRKVDSKVDKKKLEKAERKIKAKMDKRVLKVEYEESRLLNQPQEAYDDFFLSVNPLQFGSAEGRSKDVKISPVDISFAGKRILSDAALTLAHGRRYGLVGINGVGKSTLLRFMSRREVAIPSHITILHVEQEVIGDDTPALQAVLDADVWRKTMLSDQKEISARLVEIEKVRGDPAADIDDLYALDKERNDLDSTLTDVHLKLAEIEADKAESRAGAILAGLGFSAEHQHDPTRSFSGGWRMRLALARALFCRPDLLLLDEPSNMLDVPSITYLADYLQSYPSTVLVVSHDRAFLNEIATDIIHQHNERLDYYHGDFDSFQATKDERNKNQMREYENQMDYRKHLQVFIDKFRYNAAKSSEAQSRIKKLEKLPHLEPPDLDKEVFFSFADVEKMSPPIIQMTNVSFGYDPAKPILQGVDLDVQMDSRIGLVGANGAGKSTLLKILIEQLEPNKGILSRHARLRLGYFAQHHVDALDLNVSALAFCARQYPGKTDEEYRRHLGAFGITGTTSLQKMVQLSGGQKSRVAFACLSLQMPHILVLDEPTSHLDISAMDALIEALRAFRGGIILVSHDVTFIQSVCNRLWVCEDGTVKPFDGSIAMYKKRILAKAGESGVVVNH